MSLFPNDIDGQLSQKLGVVIPTITAAGSGDNTEVDGPSIDRKNATSMSVAIVAKAVLAATKTLVVKATVQDSADGTSFEDVAAALQPGGAANSTVMTLTGASGGSTESGVYQLGVNLASLRRYVRIQVLPDLNAANTDTATLAGVVSLGGLVVES